MLLDAPALPEGCEELWRIFNELHRCRGSSFGGPLAITYLDIDAFQRVSCIKLAMWELAAIRRTDAAYLNDWAERQPKPNP